MVLTPLDIEKKEFKRSFRGYCEEEVDDFLDAIIKDYETLYRGRMEAEEQREHLQEQLNQYRCLEETLKKTLVLAQQTAEEAKHNARQEIEIMLSEAREKEKQIMLEAEKKAENALVEFNRTKQEFKVFQSKVKILLESQMKLLLELEEEFNR